MNIEFLKRLAHAQNDEERTWLVTESLLATLPPAMQLILWAAAVPHWFDAEILAALRPELTDQTKALYEELKLLSFVEVFPGRGHNIHEKTRKIMLGRLWQNNINEFRMLAGNAAQYFAMENSPAAQIEAIYHWVIASPNQGGNRFWNLAQTWCNDFRLAELESLLDNINEHHLVQRLEPSLIAKEAYWRGRVSFRTYYVDEALTQYNRAILLFCEVGDQLGEAYTLKAIGDVLKFLKQNDDALEYYDRAIDLFRDLRDRLGEANTLKAIGDLLQFLKRNNVALAHYEQAIKLFREVRDRLGEANTLKAIGDVLKFLKLSSDALTHYEQAIELFREVRDLLGEANTLMAIGEVLQFLKRSSEALVYYQQAIELFREIGDFLGEANTFMVIGDLMQFLKHNDRALKYYEKAITLSRKVGSRLGEANCLQGIGSLKDNLEAGLEDFRAAHQLYWQIGDRYSQARNLSMFIADAQVKLGHIEYACQSFQEAADIYDSIGLEEYRNRALDQLKELQGEEDSTEP